MYFPSGQGWELGCSVTLSLQAEGAQSTGDSITLQMSWQDLCDTVKILGRSSWDPLSLNGTAGTL